MRPTTTENQVHAENVVPVYNFVWAKASMCLDTLDLDTFWKPLLPAQMHDRFT